MVEVAISFWVFGLIFWVFLKRLLNPDLPSSLGLIDLQKSLGDRLLEAYNEEQFIQEELKDIRTMNKQKYLEEKTIMSDERKVNEFQ